MMLKIIMYVAFAFLQLLTKLSEKDFFFIVTSWTLKLWGFKWVQSVFDLRFLLVFVGICVAVGVPELLHMKRAVNM